MKYLYADNEDSDQTARMRSLICVFVGRTCQKVPDVAVHFAFEGKFSNIDLPNTAIARKDIITDRRIFLLY